MAMYIVKGLRRKKVSPLNFVKVLLNTPNKPTLWIAEDADNIINSIKYAEMTKIELLKKQKFVKKNARLIYFDDPDTDVDLKNSLIQTLDTFFKTVIALPRKHSLPLREVFEIVLEKNPQNYTIGAIINYSLEIITIIRGDVSKLLVPFSAFQESGDGIKPNFKDFSIEDSGLTLRFGDYEASISSVLYEFDAEYRKKLTEKRAATEKTFGACLKRLRLQRCLRQSDIEGLTSKEIGRIERCEISEPREDTIKKLLKALSVNSKEEIMTF